MCYDIKTSLEAQLKRAQRHGDLQAIREIEEKLVPLTNLPLFHVSGFQHPKLLIYTDQNPNFPIVSQWGLVPHWVKGSTQLKKIWNNTLNARGETIFEKPSFRLSARNKRCIVYVDGYFEHHHFQGKTYPFYVHQKNLKPLALAGLWSEWTDKETGEILNTFSIVTTQGNNMMAKIHNNPKLNGPRMPFILVEDLEDLWLRPIKDDLDIEALEELILSYPDEELNAYTVGRLRGKDYLGNVSEVNKEVSYDELIF